MSAFIHIVCAADQKMNCTLLIWKENETALSDKGEKKNSENPEQTAVT